MQRNPMEVRASHEEELDGRASTHPMARSSKAQPAYMCEITVRPGHTRPCFLGPAARTGKIVLREPGIAHEEVVINRLQIVRQRVHVIALGKQHADAVFQEPEPEDR